MSFTAAVERLISMKKGRNGHLRGTRGTWLCFDSDDECTWQLNYFFNTQILLYLHDGNPLREQPFVFKYAGTCVYGATCAIASSLCSLLCDSMLRYSPTYLKNMYNICKSHAHTPSYAYLTALSCSWLTELWLY